MSSDGSDDHHHPRPWETVRRGLLLLISSPSGAGKTSLSRRLVADNPEPPQAAASDAVERTSARPDFQVLVYPGPLGSPAKAAQKAPPAFIVSQKKMWFQ